MDLRRGGVLAGKAMKSWPWSATSFGVNSDLTRLQRSAGICWKRSLPTSQNTCVLNSTWPGAACFMYTRTAKCW